MMDLLLLCYEFFKTGLFAVGGGLATLPFLSQMAEKYPHWFSQQMLADMIAVSESTPGPIGVNMATYAGYTVAGIPGAILATLSLVLPSLIIILLIAKALNKFKDNRYVNGAFSGLRPAVAGLIAAAGFSVWKLSLLNTTDFSSIGGFFSAIDLPCVIMFAVLFALTQIKKTAKIHPIAYIAVGALVGVVLKL